MSDETDRINQEYFINDNPSNSNDNKNDVDKLDNNLNKPENDTDRLDLNETRSGHDLKMHLNKILEQKRQIEKMAELEIQQEQKARQKFSQHIADAKNNLATYMAWIKSIFAVDQELSENVKTKLSEIMFGKLYQLFSAKFPTEYRTSLFENICEFFNDETIVTDQLLFFWKIMTVCLIKSSKKYSGYINDIVIDMENQTINLRIVKDKYVFKCFIDNEYLCLFKENGNDYYVS